MPTYCLCHHQENFFLGIDCVFFARSISAELDWQWSKRQEGIVRFMIDSKDTAQRMMCLVPKTSTACAGHENEAHLRLESQEATRPKRPKQRHPVLFLRWPHHAWASLRQCFRDHQHAHLRTVPESGIGTPSAILAAPSAPSPNQSFIILCHTREPPNLQVIYFLLCHIGILPCAHHPMRAPSHAPCCRVSYWNSS